LVREEYYPPCIKLLLEGIKEDGRKRALFALMNFFKSLNYSPDIIRQKINEWNEKNSEPLREGYVISQLNSMLRSSVFLPPNCANEGYYKALIVCKPNNLCQRIKNPLNYTLLNIRIENQNKRKKKTTKKTKRTVSLKK
jgi:DNA primase large subunit